MQDYVNKFFRCLVLGGSSFCGIFLQKDGPFKVFAAVLAAMSVKRDKVLMLTRNSGCLTIYRKYQGRADMPAVGIILQYFQKKQGGNMDENM
ncbi:MAG: hypothetical protein HFG53_00560 [Lachnospiraceae bacterium]|nr:hypothetical protein [Lachnospiraceae bacterium]RKJ03353.1 hypothetical protein D7X87_14850 [bacterium D16-54]RKJ13697.1 hypothetical protein D7X65_15355 [bacterium D16-56]